MIQNNRNWAEIVDPAEPKTVTPGLSRGATYGGYDLSIGGVAMHFRTAHRPHTVVLGRPETYPQMNTREADTVDIAPGETILAATREVVTVPVDCLGVLVGRSTAARLGIMLNVTPIEPGWSGQITLEITNVSPHPISIPAGSGIAQLLLFQSAQPAQYVGRYQNQTGVTPPQ